MQKPFATVGTFILVMLAFKAEASDCADFGFDNNYLQLHFCEAFKSVTDSAGDTTRTITEGQTDFPQLGGGFDWTSFPIIQDAYRADPATTLELIERIRKFGGLTE